MNDEWLMLSTTWWLKVFKIDEYKYQMYLKMICTLYVCTLHEDSEHVIDF